MNPGHLIATILCSLILRANAFSYNDAKNWGKTYPECKGKHQSPIRINENVKNGFEASKPNLKRTDFDKLPKKLTIKTTVEIKADWSGKPPRVTGGPLDGNYVFEKTTLHWAPTRWAEEVVSDSGVKDDFMYVMDIHMFFYKKDLKSFEKAETQKGGLAVFKTGLWIEKDDPQSWFGADQHFFENLKINLHKVQSPNSTAEIPPFRFANLFSFGEFLFYEGSLDYPPCSESVTWFLGDANGPIPERLVKELRKIKLAEGDVSNVRSVQPLNKREIKLVRDDGLFSEE